MPYVVGILFGATAWCVLIDTVMTWQGDEQPELAMNTPVLTRTIVNVVLALIGGWLVKRGVDKGDAADLIGAVVALVLSVIEGYLNRKKLLQQAPPDVVKAFTTSWSNVLLLPIAIVLLFAAAGCTSNVKTVAIAQELFASTQHELTAARMAGLIDDKTALSIEPYLAEAESDLFLAEEDARRATTQPAAEQMHSFYLDRFFDAMRSVERIALEAKSRRH